MVLNVHTFMAPLELNNLTHWGGVICDFFREATSISCVNLFVLISGYFSIKWKIRGILSLLFQVYFWIFLIYLIGLAIGEVSFTIKEFYRHCIGFMTAYWFIPAYLGLYLLAPLLNTFVEHVSIKNLGWYILIFYIFQFFDSLPFSYGMSQMGYSTFSFCGLYLIGRYLRISKLSEETIINNKKVVLAWILLITFIIAGTAICALYFLKRGGTQIFFPMSPLVYNNPLVVIQSTLILIFFTKIKLKSNIINWCAGGALAIYLLHMHPDLKEFYYRIGNDLYLLPYSLHFLWLPIFFICVAIIAIPIDKIRARIFDVVYDRTVKLSAPLRRKD